MKKSNKFFFNFKFKYAPPIFSKIGPQTTFFVKDVVAATFVSCWERINHGIP